MAVQVYTLTAYGEDCGACLSCTVSGTVFGPIFRHAGEAEAFLKWLRQSRDLDPREVNLALLKVLRVEFRTPKSCERSADTHAGTIRRYYLWRDGMPTQSSITALCESCAAVIQQRNTIQHDQWEEIVNSEPYLIEAIGGEE